MALQSPPFGIAQWVLDPSSTLADPGTGEFRINGSGGDAILAVSATSAPPPTDQEPMLDLIVEGDRLVIQRVDNALRYVVVDVGAPTDQGTWWELPVLEVVQWVSPSPNRTYVFSFRHHVTDAAEPTVSTPAPLVPVYELDGLVEDVVTALAAEVKANVVTDAAKLDRAARTAIEEVAVHIDWPSDGDFPAVYSTAALVPARVMAGLVELAATSLKRPGFAYGVVGYDEADPMAVRARGAILSALTPDLKARWGVG